jgi:hypothetical protein
VADRGRPVPAPAPSAGSLPRYLGASELIARPRAAGAWPGANGLSGVRLLPAASASKTQFDVTAAAPDGLDWLYAFAKQRGKLFSVGEWGVVPTADAGRESPEFVRWMHAWFAAHAPDLAYEAYFSDCSPNGVQSSLFRTDAACRPNPGSAAAYRELFGG